MLTNTCVLSYTELLVKKAEELYNKRRSSDIGTPSWKELPQQAKLEWMKIARCDQPIRENRLMP